MLKRLAPILIVLMAATVAHAQMGGGGGGGGGGHGRGGGGGGGGRGGGSGGAKPASAPAAPKASATPVNQIQIVGVVKAIDAQTGRVTIAYEAVEPLNWPAGSQPFPVAKTAMLATTAVGQKVRFTVDSGQISTLKPFDAPPQ
jgi:Cu/Ag efflux protein CusF